MEPAIPQSVNGRPASPGWRELTVVFLLIVSMLYGATYEPWVRATAQDRVKDVADYVTMSYGDYGSVSIEHRYRPLVPAAAGWVRAHTSLAGQHTTMAETLPFYFVNFTLVALTTLLLYLALRRLGFDAGYGLLGAAMFMTGRIVIESAALPMADAPYWLAIAAISLLVIERRPVAFALLAPVCVLAKEPIIPFLLLPVLCEREFRRPAVNAGLAAAAAAYLGQRWVVDHVLVVGAVAPSQAIDATGVATATASLGVAWDGVLKLFTRWGVHDANSAFMLLIPVAIAGWWMDRRRGGGGERGMLAIPRTFFAAIPVVALYAFMSGTLGRQIEAAFPIVIPYAVLVVYRLGAGRG